MQKLAIWIAAARLRTLPLSMSGILAGQALAVNSTNFQWSLFTLSLLTAVGFQVLSNFANDYGDGIKGTDNKHRIGPQRVLQQQLLTPKALFAGIVVCALFSFAMALSLIYLAFDGIFNTKALVFLFLAVTAIAAAYKYTVGSNAYGYRGLGDLFVFLFFGWVAVVGSFFLQEKTLAPAALLFGTTIGLLSVAVLNLNNLRDQENDRQSNKNTLVVIMGKKWARNYHLFLLLAAFIAALIGAFYSHFNAFQYLFLLAFIPLARHVSLIIKIKDPSQYDSQLKVVALSTFFLSIILLISKLFF